VGGSTIGIATSALTMLRARDWVFANHHASGVPTNSSSSVTVVASLSVSQIASQSCESGSIGMAAPVLFVGVSCAHQNA